MSELEFLHALHVDLLRHDRMDVARAPHGLFQTSTIQALLSGVFDGDVTLQELLQHGDELHVELIDAANASARPFVLPTRRVGS